MDQIFSFIFDHIWAPIIALIGWLGNRYITKTDGELAMLATRIDKHAEILADKVVKKDDLLAVVDQVKYLRDRMDAHVDSILEKLDTMNERRKGPR